MGTAYNERARVARGVAHFDAVIPGWVARIDLTRLDVSRPEGCPACMATGADTYTDAIDTLGLRFTAAIEMGFDAYGVTTADPAEYRALTQAWKWAVIERRRTAHNNGVHRGKDRSHATAAAGA